MNETFEEIIRNDEPLNKLIKDKEINVFSNFSKGSYSDELKLYIEDAYYASFKEIYGKHIGTESEGKITALLNSIEFLATSETKNLIAQDVQFKLEDSYTKLCALKNSLTNDEELKLNPTEINLSLSTTLIDILNKFGNYTNVKEYKNKIIICCLDICDLVAKASPKKETFKYAIYNMMVNNLEKIEDFDSLKERFDGHTNRISKKRKGVEVKYWIWIIVVVLIFVIRLLSKMD